MTIGARIRQSRKQKGMTQTKLAENAGISRSYLADVEADRYNPSLKTLLELAQALGIAVSCLIEDGLPGSSSEAVAPIERNHTPTTIAAHIENMDFTEEETKAIDDFVSFLASRRKQ
ncbi:MAG TPA: helix-turn-helix transcriptional regulator [Desulfosporosinus sp.]|nr:helix-turn-helix transcriptional regulator [Desulfosporosinus sp.]